MSQFDPISSNLFFRGGKDQFVNVIFILMVLLLKITCPQLPLAQGYSFYFLNLFVSFCFPRFTGYLLHLLVKAHQTRQKARTLALTQKAPHPVGKIRPHSLPCLQFGGPKPLQNRNKREAQEPTQRGAGLMRRAGQAVLALALQGQGRG